jgi:hypothetical protein
MAIASDFFLFILQKLIKTGHKGIRNILVSKETMLKYYFYLSDYQIFVVYATIKNAPIYRSYQRDAFNILQQLSIEIM